jgi:hypothetical protein
VRQVPGPRGVQQRILRRYSRTLKLICHQITPARYIR